MSEELRILELQIGRDQISEVKSGNEMLEGLRLVRVKCEWSDWFRVAERK